MWCVTSRDTGSRPKKDYVKISVASGPTKTRGARLTARAKQRKTRGSTRQQRVARGGQQGGWLRESVVARLRLDTQARGPPRSRVRMLCHAEIMQRSLRGAMRGASGVGVMDSGRQRNPTSLTSRPASGSQKDFLLPTPPRPLSRLRVLSDAQGRAQARPQPLCRGRVMQAIAAAALGCQLRLSQPVTTEPGRAKPPTSRQESPSFAARACPSYLLFVSVAC